MNRSFALLLLLMPLNLLATTDIEVSIFSKTIKLIGDCVFHPYASKNSNFVCIKKGGAFLVSFISPELAEKEFNETSTTEGNPDARTFRVISKIKKQINGFLHYKIVGSAPEMEFNAYRYQICGESECVSLTSQEKSTVFETLLQFSPELVEQ